MASGPTRCHVVNCDDFVICCDRQRAGGNGADGDVDGGRLEVNARPGSPDY
jgi:hypothetical protein